MSDFDGQLSLDLGQDVSATFETENIPISKLYRNKKNFYSVDDIKELADDILLCGLKQNLEVVEDPCSEGTYRIITGERRWLALKSLVQDGHEEFDTVTCRVLPKSDPDEEVVQLIIANTYRTKTAREMLEEEKTLKEALTRMKEQKKTFGGYDLTSGKLREVIADILKISDSKVAQMEAINSKLSGEWQKELDDKAIGITTAYELSGLSEEDQKAAHEAFEENGGKLTRKAAHSLKQPDDKQAKDKEDAVDLVEEPQDEEQDPEIATPSDYEDAHPETMTSICYRCQKYETCNVKSGTTTNCDQYELRDSLKKTAEQKEDEKQARIDAKTAEKLQQMQEDGLIDIGEDGPVAHVDKQEAPAAAYAADDNTRTVIVGKSAYSLLESGAKNYMFDRLKKEDKPYKQGELLKLQENNEGTPTGRTMLVRIVYMDTSDTVSDLKDGHVIMQLDILSKEA